MSVTPDGGAINWQMVYISLFVAQWIFNLGLGAWVYFRRADADNMAAVDSVAKELADFVLASRAANEDQNTRLTTLETTVQHMPTDTEIAAIRESVASTRERVEGISRMLERIERQTSLIQEHMLRSQS